MSKRESIVPSGEMLPVKDCQSSNACAFPIVLSGEMLPVKDNEYTEDMGKLIVPSGEMLLTGIHLMPHVYPFATCGLLSSMAVPTLESSLNPLTRIFLVPNA